MTGFSSLYEFTDAGMNAFKKAFEGNLNEAAVDPTAPALASRIPGTKPIEIEDWQTSKAMAEAILSACGTVPVTDLLPRRGLWAWLSFVLRDQVYPRQKGGQRKLMDVHRWYPASIDDYQKGQRHWCGCPSCSFHHSGVIPTIFCTVNHQSPGEVREQLTSQQDMFHPTIQAAARKLYFDDQTGKLHSGSGGKGGGSSRRFAQVRKQLDVTWDLFALTPDQLIEKLPKEFDRYKNAIPQSRANQNAEPVHVSDPEQAAESMHL